MSAGEECDDGNVVGGDGCSSVCAVEALHSCVNNASLSSLSICYYSGVVSMSIDYVYKVPLENRVELTVGVVADNINQN